MKQLPWLVVLALSLTASAPAFAQDAPARPAAPPAGDAAAPAADDPENAKTPLNLLELLPKDEKDWPKPFWLIVQGGDNDGDPDDEVMSMAWSLKRQGEDYLFEFSMRQERGRVNTSKLVYDAKGNLKSFDAVENSSFRTRTITARIEGDKVKVKTVTNYADQDGRGHRDPRTDEDTVELSELTGAVPLEWLPLVVAYHVREGNLGFGFPLLIMQEGEVELHIKAEDIGGDTVEVEGAQRKARVYRVLATENDGPDAGPDDQVTLFATFLTTGEFNSLSMKHEHFKASAKRVSEEEVAKRFQALQDEAGDE